jgi:hypothetical protein
LPDALQRPRQERRGISKREFDRILEVAGEGVADFTKFVFPIADFSRREFKSDCTFVRAHFAERADFSKAKFAGDADFSLTEFGQYAYFSAANFAQRTNFSGAQFAHADFIVAKFSETIEFISAEFAQVANFVLLVTVHAQTNRGGKFFGTWCGGDKEAGTWSCLSVTNPESEIVVKFSFQGKDGWITCEEAEFSTEELLNAVCGRAITQTVWQSSALLEMHLTIQKSEALYEDTRLLYKR